MGFGAKANALHQPQLYGVQVTTSLYNTAIPLLIGKRKISGRLIWYGYFQNSGSTTKKSFGKSGSNTYTANVDLLLGYGPMYNIQSVWHNANIVGYGPGLSSFSQMGFQTYAVTAGTVTAVGTVTSIPAGYVLDFINGITFTPTVPTSATINDYADPLSPRLITETLTQEFLYNTYFDVGKPTTYAWRPGSWALGQPYCNSDSCTYPIGIDLPPYSGAANWTATSANPAGFPAGTITVYFGCTESGHDSPPSFLGIGFEPALGGGDEYIGTLSGEQIIYPELAGLGGVNVDLGASAASPEIDVEACGLYAITPAGQANPADAILDLILSGNIYFLSSGTFTPLCFSHGLGFGGDPTRGDVFNAVNIAGAQPWPPAVTFPYVVPGNGLFQILKDPPSFLVGNYSGGTFYQAGAIVQYVAGHFYEALQYTGTTPGSDSTWRVFTPPFSDGIMDVRNYCTANGIYMSMKLEGQKDCSEVLNELCMVANCFPVWNGQTLDFYPLSECSAIGSGTVYTPRTASGPLAAFDANYFETKEGEAPVIVKQKNLQKVYNILDVNYAEMGGGMFGYGSDGACSFTGYQSNNVRLCDAQHARVYGPMNGSPLGLQEYVCDATMAKQIGWPIMKRQRFADPYSIDFALPASVASLLDPMDLITVVDPVLFGGKQLMTGVTLNGQGFYDVRIRSLEENNAGVWQLECERFFYGMSAPNAPPSTGSGPGPGATMPAQQSTPAGSINAPYFFEPTTALATALGMSTPNPLCIALSGAASNYGGCQVYLSTNGGSSYDLIGSFTGQSVMGQVTTATYPSHSNPDNVNTLYVDLTESGGELISYTTGQQNILVPIAILDGSASLPPYEVISYGTTALVSGNVFSCAPPILRGQLGTAPATHGWNPSTLVGSVFVDLSNPSKVFKTYIPNGTVYGTTLYFKFPTFNQFGSGLQDLASCVAYTFVP